MRIIKLVADNIKRLSAVEITPKGNVIKVTGKNGEGKSSVLDSILFALGGADSIPSKPIKDGSDKGEISVELDDIVVTRKFNEKGTTLKVANKDGALYGSPQKMLDKLIGKLSFDPMLFMNLKPDEQFKLLAEHAGVDFSELDAQRKEAFDERTIVNRTGKAKAAEVDAMALVYDAEAPDELVSTADLIIEINEANKNNLEISQIENKINRFDENIYSAQLKLKEAQQSVIDVQDEIKDMEKSKGEAEKEMDELHEINVDEISDKMKNVEEINKSVTAKQAYKKEFDALGLLRKESQDLSDDIKALDADREKMISESKLPVKDLSFGDNEIIFNNVPLDQASSAEQLKVSVAVVMAMNPKLRVIRIQDGSLLDSKSMGIIEEMAKENDFQFWVEQVDETGKVGIVIEDGKVKADNQ